MRRGAKHAATVRVWIPKAAYSSGSCVFMRATRCAAARSHTALRARKGAHGARRQLTPPRTGGSPLPLLRLSAELLFCWKKLADTHTPPRRLHGRGAAGGCTNDGDAAARRERGRTPAQGTLCANSAYIGALTSPCDAM